MERSIEVCEMFTSLQGESQFSGLTTFFIRTSGCNLRCNYCDSTYSYEKGEKISINSIMEEAKKSGARYICVTGGEPLLQKNINFLLEQLVQENRWNISLETNGSQSLKKVPQEVVKIVDVKLKGSGQEHSFLMESLKYLTRHDEVKFVVSDSYDFFEAENFIKQQLSFGNPPKVTLSPSNGRMQLDKLAEMLIDSGMQDVRLQLQLHKVIWGDERGR
ncbi:MAG: radical SAM protein [Nitrospinae bacterium]|nr:radical SAM protein [Nitrospinota bacterium]